MATTIPNLSISATVQSLANLGPQLNTNFQATQQALNEKLTAHRISVTGYSATGATTTTLRLGSVSPQGSSPWAVILVRARETSDQGKDIAVSSRLNFYQQGDTLFVYEPAGLGSNTKYDLDFLVLE